jgi:hypothetical protein
MTFAQMHQLADILPAELYSGVAAWPLANDPQLAQKLHVDPAVEAKMKDLYAAFAAAGKKPDEGNMLGWDPATLLVDALRALPDGATAKQVAEYVRTRDHAPGVSGMYNFAAFPQRGLGPSDVVVARWNKANDFWDVVSDFGGKPLP